MKRLSHLILLSLAMLLISACAGQTPLAVTSTSTPISTPAVVTPTPTKPAGDDLPPFMPALLKFALDKFDAKPDEVQLIKMEPVEWPDSCLGAAQAGEICASVITPGYKLQVKIKNKTYELHTDSGQTVRLPPEILINVESTPGAEAARLWLMDKLKIDSNAIQVVSVNEEDWPDGCLGVHKPGVMCTSVIVPGYRVTLETGGASYEIRASRDGKTIVLADPAYQYSSPKTTVLEHPQITWRIQAPSCIIMQVNGDQAAYGACGMKLKIVRLANPERVKELAALLLLYRPFSAQTTVGEINYYGGGGNDTVPTQQRAVAEWAQIVYNELSAAAVQPDAGLVLTWQRVGGIAGFCDNLKIYRYGRVVTSSCKGGSETQLASRWLTAEQTDQLFTWLEMLKSTNGTQSDNATADSMKITWSLTANGGRPASESEIQAIQAYASQVFMSKP
jgi:hypothetical protein